MQRYTLLFFPIVGVDESRAGPASEDLIAWVSWEDSGRVDGKLMEDAVEDIDERRLHRKAYDYLCRLLEVRNWLADCLGDDEAIPSAIDLEQNFRNGVLLARLGHAFAPDVVPLRIIFDITQEKFKANEFNPVYKHTDNIVSWRRAALSVRLPEIIIPETVDIYEGRNIQTIFCLYALATLLYRLRKTPPLRVLAGKAQFSEEELEEMKALLRDRKLPEFGAVGDFLTQTTPKGTDDAMAAVNDAVDRQNEEELLVALQKASILYVEEGLKKDYLELLVEEKRKEENNVMERERVQQAVLIANDRAALRQLQELLEESVPDLARLMSLLDTLQFEQTPQLALPLVLQFLRKAKGGQLTKEQVDAAVQEAVALLEVRLAVQQGSSEDCLRALRNPVLELKPREENALLYFNRFHYNYDKAPEDFFLSRDDLAAVVAEFEELSPEHRDFLQLRDAVKKGDEDTVRIVLKKIFVDVYVEENVEFYMRRMKQREPESVEETKEQLKEVNQLVHDVFVKAEALIRLNDAAAARDAANTRLQLTAAAGDYGIRSWRTELSHWYVKRVIEETTERREKHNGEEEKVWLREEFELGFVWMATDDYSRSTTAKAPETDTYLGWKEIGDLIDDENRAFEQHYAENQDKVVKAQTALRGFMARQRMRAEAMVRRDRELAAAKIQNQYRKYRHSKDQQELRDSEKPSLELVRRFIGVLKEREQDVAEQLEVEESRARVWQLRVANQQMDGQLRTLDEQIGLLVRNRINLQDVVEHKDKIADSADGFAFRPASIRRKKNEQQALLEQLFFYLQAEPSHIASLLLSEERRDPDGFSVLKDCVAPVFGFLTEVREAFLLTRVLAEVMLRRVERIDKAESIHNSKEERVVEEVFSAGLFDLGTQPSISTPVLPEYSGAFNLDPEDAFLAVRGRKAADVAEAAADPEVQLVLETSKQFIAEASERIAETVANSYKAPPALRYLCIFLNEALRRQLPSLPVSDVLRAVAVFAFRVHTRRLLLTVTPVSSDAHGRMESVLQFLEYAIANRGYGNSKWYLTSLNKQIHNISLQFEEVTAKLVSGSLDEVFSLNEFTHFDPSRKPTLSLLETQLVALLNYLKINGPTLGTGTGNRVQGLLSKCSAPEKAAPDRTLVLNLRPADEENGGQGDEQFVRAKQLLVELLVAGCETTTVADLWTIDVPEELRAKQAEFKKVTEELCTVGRLNGEDGFQQLITDVANDIRLATRRRLERETQKKTLDDAERTLQEQREELKTRLTRYEEYLDTCLENLGRTSRRLSIRTDTRSAEKVTRARRSLDTPKSFKSSGEKLFRKGVLIDIRVPGHESVKKQSKLQIQFATTNTKGVFQVTVFDGKVIVGDMPLDFQELLRCDDAEQSKMTLGDGVVILDVARTIQYVNKKFYDK